MAFEKCTISARRYLIGRCVSINKQSQITIGQPFRSHFTDKNDVEIYYDEGRCLIGIKPVDEPSPYTRRISVWGGNKARKRYNRTPVVHARNVLKFYGLTVSKVVHYKATWDSKKKMLVIDLNGVVK